MKGTLLVGNEIEPGVWQAEISGVYTHGETFSAKICTHEKTYDCDEYEECLDCGGIRTDNKWESK